jgi:hypothetical protein
LKIKVDWKGDSILQHPVEIEIVKMIFDKFGKPACLKSRTIVAAWFSDEERQQIHRLPSRVPGDYRY